jgi:hypothetical protein
LRQAAIMHNLRAPSPKGRGASPSLTLNQQAL